ncbi:hypothetical protein H4W32_002403 [Actinophytocola algeriensis]|uniref:Uncharacterized protein n=1 Tax=Actinophytocola algeriensis TaxID=1768010 RepID=A0A7W7Q9T8_9PSEU|nr:hypothetical protein [Actinophytocola algeriensis]MBE1474361.1 hypothetical protein [Actinophytocola algeriensis]
MAPEDVGTGLVGIFLVTTGPDQATRLIELLTDALRRS